MAKDRTNLGYLICFLFLMTTDLAYGEVYYKACINKSVGSSESRVFCGNKGCVSVSIKTREIHAEAIAAINRVVPESGRSVERMFWTNGLLSGSVWKWESNVNVTYDNWDANQPDNSKTGLPHLYDNIAMYYQNGHTNWKNKPDNLNGHPLCECPNNNNICN